MVRFAQFIPDTISIGQGVVVGQPGWDTLLEANKVSFTQTFVQRSTFTSQYNSGISPQTFVSQLNANIGGLMTQQEISAAIAEFQGANNISDVAARARALRDVAENPTFSSNNGMEFRRAFVLMQYFGYLRRDPNAAPDSDYTGYDFWLTKLNQFNGNYAAAQMVQAFITSNEYRHRFGP